jgi:enamine deaminase RidA (YjgF/YER057c/UK114 family)
VAALILAAQNVGANKPASTPIGIGEFAIDGMLVEIEAVAVVRGGG